MDIEKCINDCGKDRCHYFGIVCALPHKCRFYPSSQPVTQSETQLLRDAALKAAEARMELNAETESHDCVPDVFAFQRKVAALRENCAKAEIEFSALRQKE